MSLFNVILDIIWVPRMPNDNKIIKLLLQYFHHNHFHIGFLIESLVAMLVLSIAVSNIMKPMKSTTAQTLIAFLALFVFFVLLILGYIKDSGMNRHKSHKKH